MIAALLRRTENIRRRLDNRLFDRAVRDVLLAPPARPVPGLPVQVVSMVRTEHLRMYLVGIKAFLRRVPAGAVTVLDDGSLAPADHALLRRHVEGVEIVPLASVPTGPCPRGGCWERLLHILDLAAERYVIQLDSDVLATGPLPAVAAAVAANRSFALGTGPEFGRETLAEAAARVAGEDASVTQVAAEQALARLPPDLGGFYIRGSAGFAGFARGSAATRRRAEAFSAAMRAELGAAVWSRWGTEQVASNFLVASSDGGHVLPWPDHCCFEPRIDPDRASLIHFVGSWRFDRGAYARLARRAVAEMAGAPAAPAAA